MKVLMKVASTLFVAFALFLLYAVVNAAASTGGARVGVCIGYIAGALVLSFLAVKMWRKSVVRAG
jgi:hypothetical protein